jgi:metal-responsive CopG/Arc/MetJ family transcriptional regulator
MKRTAARRGPMNRIVVSMEKTFLNRVDAYAKKHALERADMITRGLRLVMGEAL